MKAYRKRGEVQGAVGAVIQLIVGVGVAVLVLIFIGSLGGQTYNLVEPDLDSIGAQTTVTGDTFTALNSTAVSLDHGQIIPSSLAVYNSSSSLLTNGTHYSADYTSGTVTLLQDSMNNTAFTSNYQYNDPTVKDSVKKGIISGFNALEQTGSYLPIIVLAVVIALVLFLVLGLGRGGMDGNKNTVL